jgi:hypothetical protein
MTCEEVRPNAAGLTSLPEDDPERRAAFAHGEGCPECMKALRQGLKLHDVLLQANLLEAPSPEALRRTADEIRRELRGSSRRTVAWPLVASVAVAFLVIALVRREGYDDGRSWGIAVGLALGAAVVVWRSPSKNPLLVGALALASLLFAWLVGGDGLLEPEVGVHCVMAELAAAAFPLATTLFLVRSGRSEGGPLLFATVAAAGALAGHAALHLSCPVRTDSPHLFAFHTGGVVLAAFVGFLASRLPPLLGWGAFGRSS